MPESFKKGIVQRMYRNFLDIMVLKMLQAEPMWGYRIITHTKEEYDVKLRHGTLYPLLNNMEKEGFLRSRKETEGGRTRKIYEMTSKGIQLVNAYDEFLNE